MIGKYGYLFSLVLLLLLLPIRAQAQETDLTTLSSNISSNLQSLKVEIRNLNDDLLRTTTQLETASGNLKLSEQEVQDWKERSTKLSSSLTNINEQLNSSHELITTYKTKLGIAIKWVIALAAIVVIRILAMVAGYIIYAKGIKLPRWLDILL